VLRRAAGAIVQRARDGKRRLPGQADGPNDLRHRYQQGEYAEDDVVSVGRLTSHPFRRRLQITVRLVRMGSNSVGESLSRHMTWTQHLPDSVVQFEVHDARAS
jgi:hypothetical protein